MTLLRDVRDSLASSYLLSHVDNPVAWRRWDDDSLREARERDLPIFLSVGYAACHWCHVMAHESFEDPGLAALLNDGFVPIKVDREERPDLDALYMAAAQLTTGHGGWPLSVFLLPDGRAFLAGTYYPPHDRGGQVGFDRLLGAVSDAWRDRRSLIDEQARELAVAVERDVRFIDSLAPSTDALDLAAVRRRLRASLVELADDEGGFGRAPKFPRPSYVEALLDGGDDASRDAATRALAAMARRGLYDHFGGGFARYSVDDEWHVPHFEKMLSDQALLCRAYLRAAQELDEPAWRDVALNTMAFVERDLRVSDGYAASLDADAGGVEGSHVTWTPEEFAAVLSPEDLAPALRRWRVDAPGAFEGRSIPRLAEGEPFLTPVGLRAAHAALVAARRTRVPPARDEKVLLEWNAMMAGAFLRSGDEHFEGAGLDLLRDLDRTHFTQGAWWRTAGVHARATAADLAWLIDARLDAFERTGEDDWLDAATEAATYLLAHHWDGELPTPARARVGAGLFTQSDAVSDLGVKLKDVFDGATPSSHAVATRALARLALCRGDATLLVVAQRLVALAGSLLREQPGAVPDLVDAASFALAGLEVVAPGDEGDLVRHVRSKSMTRTVVITGSGSSALLRDRRAGLVYVCRGGVCSLPVDSIEAFEAAWGDAWRS